MYLGYEMPDPQIGKIVPMPPQPIDPCPMPSQQTGPCETNPPNPKLITPR